MRDGDTKFVVKHVADSQSVIEQLVRRAAGVVGHATGGAHGQVTVRARATVVACGTFFTPLLLERSGVPDRSGQLGRNLSIHPATAAWAWFDEPTQPFTSIPQGYGVEEFHDEGLLFTGGTPPPRGRPLTPYVLGDADVARR